MTTPFNFLLSIVSMPQSNGPASEDMLREAYPELDFFFDEVADLRDTLDVADEAAEEMGTEKDLELQRCLMAMEHCAILIRNSTITPLTKNILDILTKELASHEN
jgi:hypothetical protein